jgi:hypothetical protein
MSQRILLAVVVLLAVVCIAVSVFAWLSFQQGREVNQAILAKLEALMPQPAEPALPADWAVLEVCLTEGSSAGPPVVGHKVTLIGRAFSESGDSETLDFETDDQGTAAFGPVKPGNYQVCVEHPIGLVYSQTVPLFPARKTVHKVTFPTSDAVGNIAFSVNWPEDLRDVVRQVSCKLQRDPLFSIDGTRWHEADSLNIIIGLDGQVSVFRTGRSGVRLGSVYRQARELRWFTGKYRLTQMSVSYFLDSGIPAMTGGMMGAGHNQVDRGYDEGGGPVFEAVSDDPNIWQIDVPEELWQQIRDARTDLERQVEQHKQNQTRRPGPAGMGMGGMFPTTSPTAFSPSTQPHHK